MKPFFALLLLASLAACGADGAPEAPASKDVAGPGVKISGCASFGVVKGPNPTGGPSNC